MASAKQKNEKASSDKDGANRRRFDRRDTHIVRRGGVALAEEVSRRAGAVIAAVGVRSSAGRDALREMDEGLRRENNLANPGTSADLTAAAIFVALLGDAWRSSDR